MNSQKDIFKNSEADEWFDRNLCSYKDKSEEKNLTLKMLKETSIFPKRVLEIGCSNGFRLNQIKNTFDCQCFGIDPSEKAVKDGIEKFPELSLSTGTAENLRFNAESFDVIIFGFCLYLCDRNDLFKIACEADRCLQDGGTLVVTDFYPPFPYKNKYSHKKDIYSYKMNYSRMFSWNPAYVELANVVYSHSGSVLKDDPNERVGMTLLRKNERFAYPEEPFKS